MRKNFVHLNTFETLAFFTIYFFTIYFSNIYIFFYLYFLLFIFLLFIFLPFFLPLLFLVLSLLLLFEGVSLSGSIRVWIVFCYLKLKCSREIWSYVKLPIIIILSREIICDLLYIWRHEIDVMMNICHSIIFPRIATTKSEYHARRVLISTSLEVLPRFYVLGTKFLCWKGEGNWTILYLEFFFSSFFF